MAYEEEKDEALRKCEEAKSLLPDISIAYNYQGLIFQTIGKIQLAIEAYSTATRLNPSLSAAWENLSYAEEQYLLGSKRSSEDIKELSEMEFVTSDSSSANQQDKQELIPGWNYLGGSAYLIPGTPGYRTRPGRSGYDKLDTDFELARVQGIIIRRLFSGKFRTKNVFHLIMMTMMGLVFSFSIIGVSASLFVLLNFSPYWITGFAFLVNVGLSFTKGGKGTKNKVFY